MRTRSSTCLTVRYLQTNLIIQLALFSGHRGCLDRKKETCSLHVCFASRRSRSWRDTSLRSVTSSRFHDRSRLRRSDSCAFPFFTRQIYRQRHLRRYAETSISAHDCDRMLKDLIPTRSMGEIAIIPLVLRVVSSCIDPLWSSEKTRD